MIQKMANDLITLKKKMFQQETYIPYRGIPRQNFNNANGAPARDRNWLIAAPTRLAIEAPPINTVVEIVDEDEELEDHDSYESFEASRYGDESFNDSAGDSNIGYLEYEKDEDEHDGKSFAVFTQSQSKNPRNLVESSKAKSKEALIVMDKRGSPISAQAEKEIIKNLNSPSNSLSPTFKASTSAQTNVTRTEPSIIPSYTSFNIIDQTKKTKIQMSKVEYL